MLPENVRQKVMKEGARWIWDTGSGYLLFRRVTPDGPYGSKWIGKQSGKWRLSEPWIAWGGLPCDAVDI